MNDDLVRARFPFFAADREDSVCFDNPAGTQIAASAVARMTDAMIGANANLGGHFDRSSRAQASIDDARAAAADFLGAADPNEIVFGQSMTALTFAVSRALGHWMKPGEAILLTRMDHDGNVAPWLRLADELGLTVRWLDFEPDVFEFDLSRLDELLDGVRLAAITYCSNVIGSVTDVTAITRRAQAAGALVMVDAVQFAPHGLIDVQALGCDLLVCSAYKFYGPHQAVLWGRRDLLDRLPAYRVRPASATAPENFETGTKSREAIAGVHGAIDHFIWAGEALGGADPNALRRTRIRAGFAAIEAHERALTRLLIDGLQTLPGMRIYGLTATQTLERRVPTVSFTIDGRQPAEIARSLAMAGIAVWDGDNYAIEAIRRLGLEESGGVVRVGLAHYNTSSEVERLIGHLAAPA